MKIVSNTFGLTAIINGKSFLIDLVTLSGSLHQFYDRSSKKFNPDWTIPSNQPSFKMVVRDTEGTEYKIDDAELYYNGTKIEFGSNGFSTTILPVAGSFKREEISATESAKAYRKFTIVKNLASDNNTDNDYISIKGRITTEGNNPVNLETNNIPISIIQTANGGVSYFMSISAPPITTEGGKTTLIAHLFSSDTSGEIDITSRVDGKWEKFDGSKAAGEQWVAISNQNNSSIDVKDDDVDGCEMYRYSITPVKDGAESTRIYAVTSVLDQTDNLFCELDCTGTAVPWKVNKGETAKITAKIVDKDGNELAGTGLVATIKLVKADGTSDTETHTGSLSMTYDKLVSTFGGSLTGYVSFEKPKTT